MRRTRNEAPPQKSWSDEITIGCAIVLLLIGLWPAVGRVSLVIPGATLLWLGLPSRERFLVSPPDSPKKESKS